MVRKHVNLFCRVVFVAIKSTFSSSISPLLAAPRIAENQPTRTGDKSGAQERGL
jgi:hypothetical protein